MPNSIYHVPVMLSEVTEGLMIQPDGVYVDCTFGGGGHSAAILSHLGPGGKLIVFDHDEDAKANVPEDGRVIFVPNNFRHLQRYLRLYKIDKIDGLLADLGVSSHQFDEPERGFSFRFDTSLDMRMDKRGKLTAADIISTYSTEKLHKLFERYGEVTNAKTLASTITEARSHGAIKTIGDFKNAVHAVVKGNPNKYLSQVFQALRIELNDEMGALTDLLSQLPTLIKAGGRVAVITFHSLEDRLVKNFFKNGNFSEADTDQIYGSRPKSDFTVISKKPVLPQAAELKANPRARSAKLRIAEKQ